MQPYSFESSRLKLINCTPDILYNVLNGDQQLAAYLQIQIPANWTEFGAPVFEYALNKITVSPKENIWWVYLPILKTDNMLVGSCGYKGPPDEQGAVEIGYEVATGYRNKGIATELVRLMVNQAFQHPEVRLVTALTLANENASTRVLKKNGFLKTGELNDPEDGDIWRWEISKSDEDINR